MPDGTLLVLPLAGALTLELLVEGEDSLLGVQVDVPGAASAAAELLAGLGQAVLEERGWARGGAAVGGLGCFYGVASAAAAGMGIVADSWVRFCDGVSG